LQVDAPAHEDPSPHGRSHGACITPRRRKGAGDAGLRDVTETDIDMRANFKSAWQRSRWRVACRALLVAICDKRK
jgi:hypothetical protein